jgi:hypothetical protein
MRGWGRTSICKASRPDDRLGIRATHNLVEEGKKGSVVGRGTPAEKGRDESRNSRVRGRTERGTLSYNHKKYRFEPGEGE